MSLCCVFIIGHAVLKIDSQKGEQNNCPGGFNVRKATKLTENTNSQKAIDIAAL